MLSPVVTGVSMSGLFDHSQITYRAYQIAECGGIASATVLQANDDAHALRLARGIQRCFPIEIWERARCLGRLELESLADRTR